MKLRRLLWAGALAALFSAAVWGCGESRTPFAGTYRSEAPYAGKGHVDLILKEDGEGLWILKPVTLRFKWKVEKGQIWLYTREGGIIIATPSEGGNKLNLDMSGTWHPSCPVERCVIFRRISGGSG